MIVLLVVSMPAQWTHLHILCQALPGLQVAQAAEDLPARGPLPDLLLLANGAGRVVCAQAALLAQQPSDLPDGMVCARVTAILYSADAALREAVAARKIPAITCGLSGADTLTFSSLAEERAVLCLNRQIVAGNGTVTEPFELPVQFGRGMPPFELLAAAAVACMLGDRNPLAGLSCWKLPGWTDPPERS